MATQYKETILPISKSKFSTEVRAITEEEKGFQAFKAIREVIFCSLDKCDLVFNVLFLRPVIMKERGECRPRRPKKLLMMQLSPRNKHAFKNIFLLTTLKKAMDIMVN